jgi:hypothetical protein
MSIKSLKTSVRESVAVRIATSRALFIGALVVLAGCQDVPELTSPALVQRAGSHAAVIDGAHGGGNPHFFFLPPISAEARYSGVFDASLSPVVEVCAWSVDACALPLVSRLTNVKVHGEAADGSGAHYGVNWHTNGLNLDPAKDYRLRVLVAGTELGSADIDVIRNGSEKKGVAAGAVPVVAGQTLPVKFRIEQGAVWVIGAAGGSISAADGQVQLRVPAGALTSEVGITVQPTSVAPPAGGFLVAGATYEFGPHGVSFNSPVQVTIAYDDANLPPGREEHELKLLHFTGGVWEAAAGSVVDVQSSNISGSVLSFSSVSPGGGSVITLSGSGTATIDGTHDPAEWAGAGCDSFWAKLPAGGNTLARVCVMNDATHLYVSVRYSEPGGPSGDNNLNVDLDNLDDGETVGDDGLLSQGSYFGGTLSVFSKDMFLKYGGSGCPITVLCHDLDVDDGGSEEVTGAFAHPFDTTTHEVAHPLNTADNSHDLSVAQGAVVGFALDMFIGDPSTAVGYPAGPDHAHIKIAGAVLDQQQSTIDVSVGGLAIGGQSNQKLAQVVTAGISGKLAEVRFPVACDNGALIVEIQGVSSGQPNGIVLASETIATATLPHFPPNPPSFRALAFSTPASVTAGSPFAIVLKNPTGGCGVFQGPIGDPYGGGEAYYDAGPNTPGVWLLLGDRHDLPFQTVVK